MCGIAGYMLYKPSQDSRIRMAITLLALEMESRGNQSWGTMYGPPGTEPLTYRRASSVRTSFALPESMPQALAVHTRFATTGKIKEGNAHPFTKYGVKGTVTGIHNGMIPNHFELGRKYDRRCRVDSEHIFANIADGLPLADLEGYGTIVYTHNGAWHIGRFNGGELSLAETPLGWFYASTEKALTFALRLSNIPITQTRHLKDGKLYSISPQGIQKCGRLDVSEDVFKYQWQDGWANLKSDLAGGEDEPDVIQFISEGEPCDACGEPQDLGSEIHYVCSENSSLCRNCYWDYRESQTRDLEMEFEPEEADAN